VSSVDREDMARMPRSHPPHPPTSRMTLLQHGPLWVLLGRKFHMPRPLDHLPVSQMHSSHLCMHLLKLNKLPVLPRSTLPLPGHHRVFPMHKSLMHHLRDRLPVVLRVDRTAQLPLEESLRLGCQESLYSPVVRAIREQT
jgi:hypothetical protein